MNYLGLKLKSKKEASDVQINQLKNEIKLLSDKIGKNAGEIQNLKLPITFIAEIKVQNEKYSKENSITLIED